MRRPPFDPPGPPAERADGTGAAILRPGSGKRVMVRLLDRNLAWRFLLAEAIGSSPLVPPSSGFLAVRRARRRPPGRTKASPRKPDDES